jgi:SsrA-binding protein
MSGKVPAPKKKASQPEARNRKARFDVSIEKTYEAGLVLSGDEIKSIRANRLQMQGSFARLINGKAGREAVLLNLQLGLAAEPDRSRRLLLHAKELEEIGRLLVKGMTLVPLRVYIKNGWAKAEIGLGRGRKLFDKRQLLRERDVDREGQRASRIR